jgi:hypothetical protein
MNQRIRELAEQAGASRRAGVGGLVFRDAELKKFAELIIRECAEVASDYDGAHYVGTAIEKHFGVE